MSKYKEEFTAALVAGAIIAVSLGICWNFVGLLEGVSDAPTRHTRESKGCDYTSIAQYTPGYALGCELFRYRGPKEAKE